CRASCWAFSSISRWRRSSRLALSALRLASSAWRRTSARRRSRLATKKPISVTLATRAWPNSEPYWLTKALRPPMAASVAVRTSNGRRCVYMDLLGRGFSDKVKDESAYWAGSLVLLAVPYHLLGGPGRADHTSE